MFSYAVVRWALLDTNRFSGQIAYTNITFMILSWSSPPGRRRYCFDRSDEEEEEEKEEGGATLGSYTRYRHGSHLKDDDNEDRPYETAS